MQCSLCGAHLAPGATACPRCGTPTPYNTAIPVGAYDQTVVAPSAGLSPELPPTVYGLPSAGLASPYETPLYAPPPPSAPYPVPPAYSSGAPQQGPGPSTSFLPASIPGSFATHQFQRKGRVGFIVLLIGIVALVLVLSGVGVLLVPGWLHPLPPPGPSGSPIVPAAAAIVTGVQVASAVDSNYRPTQLTNAVAVGQTLYITFDLHLNGQTGYVQAKFYRDREFIVQTDPLMVTPGVLNAAVYASFPEAIPNGTAELYWCHQADCSDRQLVAVAHFIVTAASSKIAAPGQVVMV